jgi:predicted unusual protein kinase regulating ubiquinone biosynthesis (AarF/ABC1/UbiB family)
MGQELLISTVAAEYIIGDPHPGNIKLLPGNIIGMIDFGVAAKAPTSRNSFVQLIREYHNLYTGQFDPAAFTVAALAFYDNVLTQAISITAGNMTGRSASEFIGEAAKRIFEMHKTDEQTQSYLSNLQMTRLMTQVFNKGNRFNVKLDTNNLSMLRASHIYMSTCNLIVKRAGLPASVGNEIIRRSFKSMIDYADQHGVAKSKGGQILSDERAMQLFSDWTAGIAEKDPVLYQQITEARV